ncbi:MAG TPA: hypothetical protein VI670_07655 [Thermoanaerobaculia bacterium]|jgi:hypothetical protein
MLTSLILNVIGAAIWSVVLWLFYRYRSRKIVPKVRIEPRKIVGNAAIAHAHPDYLIAILSPLPFAPTKCASEEQERAEREIFERRLAEGDFVGLRLSRKTGSVGHTIRAIETYPSLKEVYLITTVTSARGARAVQRYVKEALRWACTVVADPEHQLALENDSQVTADAYDIAKRILEKCRKGDRRATQTLVDVTGGTRSIQVGVLLACLGRNQDIQLIGSPYDAAGDPITTDSFPIIVHFEPEIRWRAE